MKRSEVNDIIREADQFMRSFGILLPPFAYYSVDDMRRRRAEIDPIVEARLGWDVTDYGAGDFDKMGLFLFTLRNGSLEDLKRGMGMCYAEKIMISRKDQLCPMHRHTVKTEDIINRGGARLAIKLYGSDPDGGRDPDGRVTVLSDGIARTVEGGDVLLLKPGESITLRPGDWHAFWGEGGDTLVGEVSTVNDDRTDNIFSEPVGRFSDIEEDEYPLHLLVSDYENWFTGQ